MQNEWKICLKITTIITTEAHKISEVGTFSRPTEQQWLLLNQPCPFHVAAVSYDHQTVEMMNLRELAYPLRGTPRHVYVCQSCFTAAC